MSSVRMCDKCERVFSENEDDWTTVTGRRKVRDPETRKYSYQEIEQDWCGKCSNGETPETQPQTTAIDSTAFPATYEEYRAQKMAEGGRP